MSKNGLIIYFDGPDGVGKSTQLKLAAQALREDGYDVHATRTLGGTHVGEMLREVMLSETPRPVETDLYIALACQYALAQDIIERREEGQLILVDRSPLSIIGYQVFADGVNPDIGYRAVDELLELIQPSLVIIYKADGKKLATRRQVRNHEAGHDYFEVKPLKYHAKVAKGFEAAVKKYNVSSIDGNQPLDDVHADTMRLIDPLLKT